MSFASLLLITLAGWAGALLLVIFFYRATLFALWREPVLRHPVLIIESDDWGAGPLQQSEALQDLSARLSQFRDQRGHAPVMTLAMILVVADGGAIRASGRYQRRTLQDPLFTPLREAIAAGVKQGVFALQLHGLEHYWPENLMRSDKPQVQEWLRQTEPQATEPLPSHLQSRWTDASTLPSRPLPDDAIRTAVNEEVALYQTIFGTIPAVVVPPTFLWTDAVEKAWAAAGVEFIVTPGRRNSYRDANGKPAGADKIIRNGETNAPTQTVPPRRSGFSREQHGQIQAALFAPDTLKSARGAPTKITSRNITYIVRDDYFEPMMGHTADKALTALATKTALGRPCLLETHRANFIGDPGQTQNALIQLETLLHQALQNYPGLRFTSTETLARAHRGNDPEWIETRPGRRLALLAKRITIIPRLGKLARLSGLCLLLNLSAHLLKQCEANTK